MFTTEQARAALDASVYTTDGEKVGKVGQIYLDDETNEPEWVTVATGLFGTRESFVPLADARLEGDRVVVPYGKDKIKDAPQIDAETGQISREEEGQLYRYYGKDYRDEGADSDLPEGGLAATGTDRDGTRQDRDREVTGADSERSGTSLGTDSDLTGAGTERGGTGAGTDRDVTGADTDRGGTSIDTDSDLASDRASDRDSDRAFEGTLGRDTSGSTDDALRRAEEQLNAGTRGQGGRMRLRKYIVTEEQTITVPVLREEVRVEHEPETDAETGSRNDSERDQIDLRGERSSTERTS